MLHVDVRLEEIARQCLSAGLRFTTLRAVVMRLILQSKKPVKAYDILSMLQLQRESAAPPTVYRTLDFLVTEGFVHKVEALNAFIACDHVHPHKADILLICEVCQHVVEFDHQALQSALVQMMSGVDFMPTVQKIELKGICAACHTKNLHEKK